MGLFSFVAKQASGLIPGGRQAFDVASSFAGGERKGGRKRQARRAAGTLDAHLAAKRAGRGTAAAVAITKTLAKPSAQPVAQETTFQKIKRLEPLLQWPDIAAEVGLSVEETMRIGGASQRVVRAVTGSPAPSPRAPVRAPPRSITPSRPQIVPAVLEPIRRLVEAKLERSAPASLTRETRPMRSRAEKIQNFVQRRCIPPFFDDGRGGCELDIIPGHGGAGQGQPGTGVVVFEDAVTGSFGMPAIRPRMETRTHSTCPTGMVLGTDGLCYPKAVLRRDSKFRKWRPGTRPVLTGGEVRAIAKARNAITRGRDRMAGLGVTVKKK